MRRPQYRWVSKRLAWVLLNYRSYLPSAISQPFATTRSDKPRSGRDNFALSSHRRERKAETRRIPKPARQAFLQPAPGRAPQFVDIVHRRSAYAAWPTGMGIGSTRACSRTLGQSIKRSCPLISSTSEVQLSTQSPSLQ
jgi:hypothetical protein